MARRKSSNRDFEKLVQGIADSGFIPDAIFRDRGLEPLTMNEFLGLCVGCGSPLSANARRSLNGVYEERLGVSLRDEQIDTYAKASRRIGELRRGESSLRRAAALN